jgi:hypothetical protein
MPPFPETGKRGGFGNPGAILPTLVFLHQTIGINWLCMGIGGPVEMRLAASPATEADGASPVSTEYLGKSLKAGSKQF